MLEKSWLHLQGEAPCVWRVSSTFTHSFEISNHLFIIYSLFSKENFCEQIFSFRLHTASLLQPTCCYPFLTWLNRKTNNFTLLSVLAMITNHNLFYKPTMTVAFCFAERTYNITKYLVISCSFTSFPSSRYLDYNQIIIIEEKAFASLSQLRYL